MLVRLRSGGGSCDPMMTRQRLLPLFPGLDLFVAHSLTKLETAQGLVKDYEARLALASKGTAGPVVGDTSSTDGLQTFTVSGGTMRGEDHPPLVDQVRRQAPVVPTTSSHQWYARPQPYHPAFRS
jgi:hypothetical protein